MNLSLERYRVGVGTRRCPLLRVEAGILVQGNAPVDTALPNLADFYTADHNGSVLLAMFRVVTFCTLTHKPMQAMCASCMQRSRCNGVTRLHLTVRVPLPPILWAPASCCGLCHTKVVHIVDTCCHYLHKAKSPPCATHSCQLASAHNRILHPPCPVRWARPVGA